MISEYQLRVLPQQAYSEATIKEYISREKAVDARTIKHVRVLKRSIDARQRTIYINLKVRVYINEEPEDDAFEHVEYGDVSSAPSVVVVGEGPGGLFASLRLIELGLRPVVLERGKDVHERKRILLPFQELRRLTAKAIIVSVKVAQELIQTESSILAARKEATPRKY